MIQFSSQTDDDQEIEVSAHVEKYADAIGAPPEMRHMAPGYEVEILHVTPDVKLSRREMERLEDEALSRALSGREWEGGEE